MRKLLVFLLLFASLAEARVLKQSTATTVNIGPFRKISDGTNEDTVMSGSGMSISFIKQSDTLASTVTTVSATNSGGSVNDCVFVAKGTYNCELTTTNTDTLGRLDIIASSTGTYGSRLSFDVISADSYAFTVEGDIMDNTTFLNSSATVVTDTSSVFYPIRNMDAPISSLPDSILTSIIVEPTIPLGDSPTLSAVLAWLKITTSNKLTVTNTTKTYYTDADVAIGHQTLSDNGTTATATKVAP